MVTGCRRSRLQKLLQQNKKKKEKRLWNKNALTVFVSLLTQAWSTLRSEVSRGIRTVRACQFCPCSYLVLFACEDSSVVHNYACCCFSARAGPANESQLKRRNRKRKYRCFLKNAPLKKETAEKKETGLAPSKRSDEVHTKRRTPTSSCKEATQPCLPDNVIGVIYAAVFGRSMHSFMHKHNRGEMCLDVGVE